MAAGPALLATKRKLAVEAPAATVIAVTGELQAPVPAWKATPPGGDDWSSTLTGAAAGAGKPIESRSATVAVAQVPTATVAGAATKTTATGGPAITSKAVDVPAWPAPSSAVIASAVASAATVTCSCR